MLILVFLKKVNCNFYKCFLLILEQITVNWIGTVFTSEKG